LIQEHAWGEVVDITEDGRAVITAALPNLFHALDRKYKQVEIILPDGRKISPQQRRMIYALIADIADFVHGERKRAEVIEDTKTMMKWEFILSRMEAQERRLFSLSNCDMTTAREFITFLVDFIIKYGIPTEKPLIENAEDIGAYIYSCLVNKRCACCGRPCDLHHVQSVGSQGYRDKINHLGLLCLPLCREHHTDLHKMGDKDFMQEWHLEPVKIDEKIAKVYRLNTK
jgi:hypothetical protein